MTRIQPCHPEDRVFCGPEDLCTPLAAHYAAGKSHRSSAISYPFSLTHFPTSDLHSVVLGNRPCGQLHRRRPRPCGAVVLSSAHLKATPTTADWHNSFKILVGEANQPAGVVGEFETLREFEGIDAERPASPEGKARSSSCRPVRNDKE